jgi:YidC/Oxa1 family membrane protein insertase
MFGNRSAGMSEALCRHEGETERKSGEDLYTRHGYRTPEFVAVENVYFVQALAPNGEPAEMCGLHASSRAGPEGDHAGTLYEGSLVYPVVELDPGEEHSWRTLAYVGPKVQGALENAGHSLTEVVNLGMFATIARWFAVFLTWIASHVGNWGLAIIILTICVRLVLFPLNERSFRSMARIRKLKPEMDEINARFSGDAEKKNAAIMELYRKHGINPLAQLGGCLPLLLQMPVFFALYTSLSTNIDLYHRPFVLYWQDLSAHDPYFVLPLMLGALMWLQQKLTPTAMDPAQARVMQIMPVIMTVFMLFLPSGLCLYMVTNSILSMSQQRLNEWRLGREQAVTATAVDGGSPVEDDAVKDTDRTGVGGKTAPATRGPGRSRRG